VVDVGAIPQEHVGNGEHSLPHTVEDALGAKVGVVG
jgi:hypothetical protein